MASPLNSEYNKNTMQRQWIIHIDMDAFYASVEQRDTPELQGKPVIVAGTPEMRGVVCAASYEARKFGIHSAMPTRRAIKLCPHAIVLPVRMERYVEISHRIHNIFQQFTSEIEPISLDEAFLDVTGSIKLFGSAEKIATDIKRQIKDQLGLIASVGIAPNKFLAKLASDLDKPDGFVIITEENKQKILDPLSVAKIWGIGKTTEQVLKSKGIYTIRQIREAPLKVIKNIFGSQTQEILELANGIDNRKVESSGEAKSLSTEQTFAKDISERDTLLSILLNQVEDIAYRLRKNNLAARTITLKLRYSNFRTITRSVSFENPTNTTQILWEQAKQIFVNWHNKSAGALRLMGFGVSNLQKAGTGQLLLFTDPQQQKQEKIDNACDKIRDKFGENILKRGL